MTPTDEATFIALWSQGLSQDAIARQLGIPVGTVKSRAHTLAHAGKLTPRPRGGVRPQGKTQPEAEGLLSTVHPEPSTVDPVPSTVHPLQADLTAALTAALQPVLARLEALETGLARQHPTDRPPSTIHPDTVDGPPSQRPPSTVDPDTWELKALKHSVRWTVYVPQAMKDEIQRRASARGQPPSVFLQELLGKALTDH